MKKYAAAVCSAAFMSISLLFCACSSNNGAGTSIEVREPDKTVADTSPETTQADTADTDESAATASTNETKAETGNKHNTSPVPETTPAPSSPEAEPDTADTEIETEEEEEIYTPITTVEPKLEPLEITDISTQDAYANADGQEVFELTVSYPRISDATRLAYDIINEYYASIAARFTASVLEEILPAAQAQQGEITISSADFSYKTMYNDQGFLCIRHDAAYSETGTIDTGAELFNVNNGKKILLFDFLSKEGAKEAVAEEIIGIIEPNASLYPEDYDKTVYSALDGASFFVSGENITILYPKYTFGEDFNISPEFTIDASVLKDYIDPSFEDIF